MGGVSGVHGASWWFENCTHVFGTNYLDLVRDTYGTTRLILVVVTIRHRPK